MITDQDVIELYRCLLGRAPESADTIAAFKAYYPDFAAGRRAVLESVEFARVFASETGRTAALVADAMLRQATPLPPAPAEGAIAAALRDMLRRHGTVRLAVVAGHFGLALEDLLPVEGGALVVHFAGPDAAPGMTGLAGATALLTCQGGPEQAAAMLGVASQPIDLLAVADDPAWFSTLHSLLADRAILVSGRDFPPELDGWDGIERPLRVGKLQVRHRGGFFLPVRYTPRPAAALPEAAPRLALAAIVRNEEAAVANMLASAAPVAACFVVVDTGSTDATMERARAWLEATGKPFVLHRIEADRFDTMRNAALDLVPPDADWVLMLDADEELAPEDHAPLLDLLRHASGDAYALPRYNYLGPDRSGEVSPYPDRQVRLLRHRPENRLRYSGAVHETVRDVAVTRLPLDAGAVGGDPGGPHIHHRVRRYRSPEAEAEKQARYRRIAEAFGAEK